MVRIYMYKRPVRLVLKKKEENRSSLSFDVKNLIFRDVNVRNNS